MPTNTHSPESTATVYSRLQLFRKRILKRERERGDIENASKGAKFVILKVRLTVQVRADGTWMTTA